MNRIASLVGVTEKYYQSVYSLMHPETLHVLQTGHRIHKLNGD